VLQGIRGALIQTRAVKSIRVLPSRTYYLGTSIGSFVHAADELHHTEEESYVHVPSSQRKKHHGALMGTQLRVKNRRRCVGGKLYEAPNCCVNTFVTLQVESFNYIF